MSIKSENYDQIKSNWKTIKGNVVVRSTYLFTSESVSEGHPDKVSDRISDTIVDAYFDAALKEGSDPWQVRVAAETLTTTNKVVIAGEVRLSLIHI